jgi:hypothetical protein
MTELSNNTKNIPRHLIRLFHLTYRNTKLDFGFYYTVSKYVRLRLKIVSSDCQHSVNNLKWK